MVWVLELLLIMMMMKIVCKLRDSAMILRAVDL